MFWRVEDAFEVSAELQLQTNSVCKVTSRHVKAVTKKYRGK